MGYEARIGWRYLYRGARDRRMVILAASSLGVTILGLVILLTSSGGNSAGVLMFVLGMIAAAVFTLLSVFTVFTSVSVLGVALGVAALTIVLAVTTGFQQAFRDQILGGHPHVIVSKPEARFAEYREVMRLARGLGSDVVAAQPFLLTEMLATRGKGQLSGVLIKGVDPKLVRGVLDLDERMIPDARGRLGTVDDLAKPPEAGELSPILMGKEIAYKLKANVGDTVTVVVPLLNVDFDTWRAASSAPRTRKFRVAGIFYSGFDLYDGRLMYAALDDLQDLVGSGDQVLGVELKVKDGDRAEHVADRLETVLGGLPYQVQDWREVHHNLMRAVDLQKLVLVIILTLIIVVAAVNMVSALTMMVTDKTREIAILKSMGSTSGSVARMFRVVGFAIGGIGTLIGVGIGLSTCYVVSAYGYRLDPKAYLIDRLPIEVRPVEVLLVVGITMVISVIATIAPSASAFAMRPVDGLRYD